jgi:hypothetical protein
VDPGAGLDRCGKSRPTGIRSPDLPARSNSIYRLSYPGYSTMVEDGNSSRWSDYAQKNNRFDSVVPTPQTSELGQITAELGQCPVVTRRRHQRSTQYYS